MTGTRFALFHKSVKTLTLCVSLLAALSRISRVVPSRPTHPSRNAPVDVNPCQGTRIETLHVGEVFVRTKNPDQELLFTHARLQISDPASEPCRIGTAVQELFVG